MRVPRFAPALVIVATLAACGGGEARYAGRTAREWAGDLWLPDDAKVDAATASLVSLAQSAPDEVLAAVEAALVRPPPVTAAAIMRFVVDEKAREALGIPPTPPMTAGDATQQVMRLRLLGSPGAGASYRVLADGQIEVEARSLPPREDLERVQRALAVRGAFSLEVVVPDPARGPVAGAARPMVFDGPGTWAETLAAEAARERAARVAGKPYVPAQPRWRAVPRAAGAEPAGHVLVEQPADDAAALDDRMVFSTESRFDAHGRLVVAMTLKPERVPAWRAFVERNAGLTMALVLDGVLRGTCTIPPAAETRDVVELALWPVDSPAARGEASDLAMTLRGGRLPFPVTPRPIPDDYGRGPPPRNPASLAFAALGPRAVPTLERIAASTSAPEWSRASAAWAREEIRATSKFDRAPAPGTAPGM